MTAEHLEFTPVHLMKPDRLSYIELIEADWPDFASIKAFEEDVAAGIVRRVAQRLDLLWMMPLVFHDDHRREVRRLVWNKVAPSWVNSYDCGGPDDDLWVAAMWRAYYKVSADTFEFPSERNEEMR
jgi:hypothetical protein